MRLSISVRYSFCGVSGVGSRRAQKRSRKAWASWSVFTFFHAAASSFVRRACSGPRSAANTEAVRQSRTAAVNARRVFMWAANSLLLLEILHLVVQTVHLRVD